MSLHVAGEHPQPFPTLDGITQSYQFSATRNKTGVTLKIMVLYSVHPKRAAKPNKNIPSTFRVALATDY